MSNKRVVSDAKSLSSTTKPALQLVPKIGMVYAAEACRNGALEKSYGAFNWRENGISMMEFLGALERHLFSVQCGEDIAPDSMCEHLGHIIATASIILDARENGALVDDRPKCSYSPDLVLQRSKARNVAADALGKKQPRG